MFYLFFFPLTATLSVAANSFKGGWLESLSLQGVRALYLLRPSTCCSFLFIITFTVPFGLCECFQISTKKEKKGSGH